MESPGRRGTEDDRCRPGYERIRTRQIVPPPGTSVDLAEPVRGRPRTRKRELRRLAGESAEPLPLGGPGAPGPDEWKIQIARTRSGIRIEHRAGLDSRPHWCHLAIWGRLRALAPVRRKRKSGPIRATVGLRSPSAWAGERPLRRHR